MVKFASKHSDEEKQEIIKILDPILPNEYEILLIEFVILKRSNIIGEDQFNLKCRVNVDSKEGIDNFICKLNEKSGTSYNKFKGDKSRKGTKVVVSGARKCQHAVRRHHLKDGPTHSGPGRQPGSERQAGKNTCCPAKLSFSLSGEKLHTSKSKKLSLTSQYKTNYPLEIRLEYTHNHSINSADAMRYRTVSDDCKNKFTELFQNDHTPSSAFAQYKNDLLLGKNSLETITIMADRHVVPDYFWVFHFHKKYVESTYGPQSGPDAYKLAKQRIDSYNEKHGMELSKIETTKNGDVIVVICDEFCRRVHENVPQAGDIVLVDATSNLDRHDTKLFHLICPTPAGGLPLGVILTSREDEETIDAAISLFKTVLPDGAFFHRGAEVGPKIIMTDDCAAERNAIKSNWPTIILLLCVFHLLQAFWRWLWDSDHKIEKYDRPTIFNSFKSVVYAPNEDTYKEMKEELLNNETVLKYENLLKHVQEEILPRKEEWSLTTRFENNYSTHSVNTTNYAEVSFRITKENQFNRVKAYNLADLLDIILDDSEYYMRRCIDIGNNRTSELYNQKSRYLPKKCDIDVNKIIAHENGLENSFLVPSERIDGKYYEVNMDLGLCECPMGMLRGPCKHKHLVAARFPVISPDIIPSSDSASDSALRAFYHNLATGTQKDKNWYRPLSQCNEVEESDTVSNDIFKFMRPISDTNASEDIVNDLPSNLNLVPAPSYMAYNSDGERIAGGADPSDDDDDITDQLINDFKEKFSDFSEEVINRLKNDFAFYKGPVNYFTKNLGLVTNGTAGMFSKAMYSFASEVNFAAKKGKKKTGRRIGIGSTHRSRRLYKARGSGAVTKGRPSKVVQPRKRGSEPVPNLLPTKKRKKKNPHSLSKSVTANRAAEKKH